MPMAHWCCSTTPGVSNGTSAFGDARLGAGDALLHRRSVTRNARAICFNRQAGNDAQRQRDLLRRRQIGMAADEQQPQNVVAVMRAVEPFGQRFLGVVRDRRSPRPRAAAPACDFRLMSSIATLRPTMISQAAGSRGGPFLRPAFQRAQAGVLERFLGGVEIAEIAQQRADRLGTRRGQRASIQACRSRRNAPWIQHPYRANFISAAGIGRPEIAGDVERLVEILAVDDVEASNCSLVSA